MVPWISYLENAQVDTNPRSRKKENNHRTYMDDIKLFAKNKKESETLIHAVSTYSEDMGIEFGIEKYDMLIMKSGKKQMTEGIELQNQENIKTSGEKTTYKYLGILEVDTIKSAEIKDKIKKE